MADTIHIAYSAKDDDPWDPLEFKILSGTIPEDNRDGEVLLYLTPDGDMVNAWHAKGEWHAYPNGRPHNRDDILRIIAAPEPTTFEELCGGSDIVPSLKVCEYDEARQQRLTLLTISYDLVPSYESMGIYTSLRFEITSGFVPEEGCEVRVRLEPSKTVKQWLRGRSDERGNDCQWFPYPNDLPHSRAQVMRIISRETDVTFDDLHSYKDHAGRFYLNRIRRLYVAERDAKVIAAMRA